MLYKIDEEKKIEHILSICEKEIFMLNEINIFFYFSQKDNLERIVIQEKELYNYLKKI